MKLTQVGVHDRPVKRYEIITESIKAAAASTLPPATAKLNKRVKYIGDAILTGLSHQQKQLTARIFQHGVGIGSNRTLKKQERLKKINQRS